jgi:hypothetical protein
MISTISSAIDRRLESTGSKLMRVAAGLQLAGFALLLIPLLKLTPGTFTMFTVFGLPLIGLGLILYVVHVLKVLVSKGAL